jgi:sarcosine oxidase subunit alpha
MAPRRIDVRGVAAGPTASVLRALYQYAPPDRARACTVEYDGRSIAAREGEPIAVSLLGAGVDTLSRSVKFHRPRGPMCLRSNCEGCLTRIDGEPNRMACAVAARDGREVCSQNAFPSAQLDLMRVTDWFFPKQFDHHHLMVRYGTTINEVMQGFARKMAGLGTLPERGSEPVSPEELRCDALVVGLGPAGLDVSERLARAGLDVLAVEEEPLVGGLARDSLRWHLREGTRVCGAEWADRRLADVRRAGVRVRLGASACATFDDGTIVIAPERALWVRPRIRVFANGSHESAGIFADNDLPGVYTARAVARALRHGVSVGDAVLVCGASAEDDALADALAVAGVSVSRLAPGESVREALGLSAVRGAVLATVAGGTRQVRCDAIASDGGRTPAFELAAQAGVETVVDPERRCFRAGGDEDGRTLRRDVFVVGSVAGDVPGGDEPERVAAAALRALREGDRT